MYETNEEESGCTAPLPAGGVLGESKPPARAEDAGIPDPKI